MASFKRLFGVIIVIALLLSSNVLFTAQLATAGDGEGEPEENTLCEACGMGTSAEPMEEIEPEGEPEENTLCEACGMGIEAVPIGEVEPEEDTGGELGGLSVEPVHMVLEDTVDINWAEPVEAITPLPTGWQTIKTEDFEGAFPNTWNIWVSPGYTDAYWDDDSYNPHWGSWSGFCADEGAAGVNPPSDYPNNMRTWMAYGPFSLADATDAELNFYDWLKTESDFDYFKYLASIDGNTWYGWQTSGDSHGWEYRPFDLTDVPTLGNICGQPEVWIAFVFTSDESITNQGVFIDDVVLQKNVATVSFDLEAVEVYLSTIPGDTGKTSVVGTPTVGQNVYFHVKWNCIGSGTTPSFRRELKLDGSMFCYGEGTADGGYSYTTWCNSPWTATAGAHTLTGVLDVYNTVSESNEANNQAGKSWNSGEPDIDVTPVHLDFECSIAGSTLSYETLPSDDKIEMMIIDSPPTPPVNVSRTVVNTDHLTASAVILNDVPTSEWTYGCTATSAGMLFGYYDRTGYPNMYTGPTNGGVCPLTDLGQGQPTNPRYPIPGSCYIIATENGLDGIGSNAHVDDYWISYGSAGPDPWEGNWPEHTWGLCTADFLGTNQWKWDFSSYPGTDGVIDTNTDGSTIYWTSGDGSKLYDWCPGPAYGTPMTDCSHGMRLFAESLGYSVEANYNQKTDNQHPNGFTFTEFKAEIDAGRPVLIQVTGHTMVGLGYDAATNSIYIHDTWDNNVHSMTWGGSYAGMNLQAVTVIHLAPPEENCQTITISNVGDGNLIVSDIEIGYQSGELTGWLDANPKSFTVLSGSSQPVNVCVDSTGLISDTYHGWLDIYSNDPDENPVRVTVTLFVTNQYNLTISSTSGGSVTTPGEGTFTYDEGTVVDLVATPDAGFRFVNWTGDVGTIADVDASTTTIAMNGHYSITANFVALYDLTTSSTAGGSVTTPGEGTFSYDEGTVVDIVATPDAGYRFVNWTGDVSTVGNVTTSTTTIAMNGDYSITANFVALYDLTTSSTAGGSVTTPGEGTFTYDEGTVVDLVATPDFGYDFVNWTGDVGTIADVDAPTTTITMNGNYSITANFIANNPPEVSNVSATQRSDGSGIVDISYDVSDGEESTVDVSLEYWDGSWHSCTNTAGDVGPGTNTGTGKTVTWDAKAQLGPAYISGCKVRVTAADGIGGTDSEESNTFDIDTTPPTGACCASPENEAECVSINEALVCSIASDDSTPIEYKFAIASDAAFSQDLQESGWQPSTNWTLTTALSYGKTYWWKVKARDAKNNESDWSSPFTFVTIYKFDLALKSGWNMISLPLESCTGETDPGVILPDVEAIYAWNSETTSFDSPSEIVPGEGYWVLVFEDVTETIYGTPVEEYQLSSSYEGWHMVGSLYVDGQVNVGGGSVYGSLYHWNPGALSYVARPLDDARPGEGYWLLAFTDFSISVVPQPPVP